MVSKITVNSTIEKIKSIPWRILSPLVREHNFFNAENILLAFHDDAHNHIKKYLPDLGLMLKNVPFLSSNHYYAFL